MVETSKFAPKWISPPGETIASVLDERGMSVRQLAEQMGESQRKIGDLVVGRTTIDAVMARKLSAVIGATERFWLTREADYRRQLNRLEKESSLEESQAWLGEIPWRDMVQYGWIKQPADTTSAVTACLQFFGVPDVPTWRRSYDEIVKTAAFRTSSTFKSDIGAVAAWLRRGEIEAGEICCKKWDAEKFRAELPRMRELTRKKDPAQFLDELQKRCAECGVAVVVVRAPAKCRASGAARFVSPSRPILHLSFRFLSDDHFWFSFFHEAAHLILHRNPLVLEGDEFEPTKEEEEANAFAGDILVPPDWRPAMKRLHNDALEIIRFAREVGVSPGVIVGQLQHLGRLRHNQLNNLKRRFSWAAT